MQILSEKEVLSLISRGKTFEARLKENSLEVKILDYTPYFCTAIHAGSNMRPELAENCLLTKDERKFEEDPFTDDLIASFPITLVSRDSRYEYDLNRPPNECIYSTAWHKQVWKKELTEKQIDLSLKKHSCYYRILHALINKLNEKYGNCLVIDLHSYNWKLPERGEETAVFNLGTTPIDLKQWDNQLKAFEKSLAEINIPNVVTTVERDSVFQGKGYQAQYVMGSFPEVLIIPLEIKKIFMDESTGEVFPIVIECLQEGLYQAVLKIATNFSKKLEGVTVSRADLMPSDIEPVVYTVDKALYKLAMNIDTLYYVNPINIQQEKRRFLSRRHYEPEFHYRQLRVDPYSFRESLYQLPVSEIQDPVLRSLYRSVVDNYATKIELLTNVGTPQFLYNSLRYYGEPSLKDIRNAEFILHAPEIPELKDEEGAIKADQAKVAFEKEIEQYGFKCKTLISPRIVANAMVDNKRLSIIINRNSVLTKTELNALIHHELGIHMVTTMNAKSQSLRILELSLPGNTYTQEGLAILSEYLSGNLTLNRVVKLALRVIAVDMMIKGADFTEVFNTLRSKYCQSKDGAFSITTRVFRGGGFTKDYLYLRGFKDMVTMYHKHNMEALIIGKSSHLCLDILDELIERKVFNKPKFLPKCFSINQIHNQKILDYLVEAIK